MATPDDQRKAWRLAFEAPHHITQDDIVERCAKIQAIVPDLRTWDPAGRGSLARPCQWLLDLIQCAGLAEVAENEQGYPARGMWGPSRFYVGMAAQLSRFATPDELLMVDDKTPIPPGVSIQSDANPKGEFRFSLTQGSALDALFDDWLMSDSKPHSTDDLFDLTLNMLRGVALTPEQGGAALGSLLRNNGCFQSVHNCYRPFEAQQIAQALLEATPGFQFDSLGVGRAAMGALRQRHPELPGMIESAHARSEAKQIAEWVSKPSKKSSPAPRI